MLQRFRVLYLTRACSVMFNRIIIMAIAIYLFSVNQEPYTVALCFFWANFPSLLGLGFCRRWLMTTPNVIRFAVVVELLVAMLGCLMYFLLPHLAHPTLTLTLYIVVSVYLSNMSKITHQLFTKLLLDNDWQLSRANTFNEILYNLSWIVAVPLGAWSVKVWSLSGLFFTNSLVSLMLVAVLVLLFRTMHNRAKAGLSIDTLSQPKPEKGRLLALIRRDYKGVFFWNYLRNMTSSFMSASMIPLVLATHGLSDLIWISLVGNLGVLLAIYRPLPFDEQNPARLLVFGQLLMSLALLSMILPWLISMCAAFFAFLYGIITTNSLEAFIIQKRASDAERGPLFSSREQMAIFGRTSGYVFSALLPWLFMGAITEPNALAVAIMGTITLLIAAYHAFQTFHRA